MPHARTLRLNAADNIIVALETIEAGTAVGDGITAINRTPRGHKLAAKAIPQGEAILKFGQIIGFASAAIPAGAWVHEHNVVMKGTSPAITPSPRTTCRRRWWRSPRPLRATSAPTARSARATTSAFSRA